MRHFADIIAPHAPEREHKPIGPLVAIAFVLAVIASSTGAAYFIGSSIAGNQVVVADTSGE